MLNVSNLSQFERFIRLLAGRSGQLLNFSAFLSDAGVSHPTASSWMSVLEASFITFRLAPHFNNFSKRLIKTPKCYFWDSGLLCHLLQIRNPKQLETHPLRGQIFENWVISEYFKAYAFLGEVPPLYFWRDQSGHEIDLLIDKSTHLFPIEIKSSQTFHENFINTIQWFNDLQGATTGKVVYGGDKKFDFKDCSIAPWFEKPKVD